MWLPVFLPPPPLTALLCFTRKLPSFPRVHLGSLLYFFSLSHALHPPTNMTPDSNVSAQGFIFPSCQDLLYFFSLSSPSSLLLLLFLVFSAVLPSQEHVSPFLLPPFPPASTPLRGLPHSYIYNYLSVLTPTHLSSAVSCSQMQAVSPKLGQHVVGIV